MNKFEKITTGLGEECGVFGAYDMSGGDVAPTIYYGLFALQHRGQESCGIAVTDTNGERKVHFKKGLGLVNEVFDRQSGGWPCAVFNSRSIKGRECDASGYQLCERCTGDCT